MLDRVRAADAVKSLVLTGRVSERKASEYLALADLCALPYEDGISTKRTSFMAAVDHGLPIVTTFPHAEIAELRDGKNVMFVAAGDVPGLAKTILAILNDQNQQETLRRNVVDLKRFYSWETITKRMLCLYRTSGSRAQ